MYFLCTQKDARALMYPVFQNSRTPFIYWLSRNLVCSFFVAGFCSFFVADKKRRNTFVQRGFRRFTPQKKFAIFCRWQNFAKSLYLSAFPTIYPPKKVCYFLSLELFAIFCCRQKRPNTLCLLVFPRFQGFAFCTEHELTRNPLCIKAFPNVWTV